MFEMSNLWRPWDEDGGEESRLIQVKRADCEDYNILLEMITSVKPSVPSIIFLLIMLCTLFKMLLLFGLITPIRTLKQGFSLVRAFLRSSH